MEGSIILNSPVVLLILGVALLLGIASVFVERPGILLPFLSAVIFIAGLVLSFFLGADIKELIIVLLIFTGVWLLPYSGVGGGKK